jgi:hypothetical protein
MPEEWVGVLRLTTSSRLPEIREIAVQKLNTTIKGIERVQLGCKFGIENWLISGYQALIEQSDPISEADKLYLGQEVVSKLFKLRHRQLQG